MAKFVSHYKKLKIYANGKVFAFTNGVLEVNDPKDIEIIRKNRYFGQDIHELKEETIKQERSAIQQQKKTAQPKSTRKRAVKK